MFSLQLSLVSVADNSHFCMFHINPYAKHKIPDWERERERATNRVRCSNWLGGICVKELVATHFM